MLFSQAQNQNSIEIPFNWNAEYADGRNYSEYDLYTHQKNDFYLIQTNEVIRFGLFGMGMKFFYEVSDGSFNLDGKRIEIEYHTEDEIYQLTTNFNQKDIITYKKAEAVLIGKQGSRKSNIKSINFGYKTTYKKNDTEIFFQPVVSLPFDDKAFIETKLTSNKSMDGHLVFKSKGVEIERFYAPLEESISGQINWTVK